MPKIYVAGPMTGIEGYNFPAFFEAADALHEGGWTVFNPAQHDLDVHGTMENLTRAFELDRDGNLRSCLAWDLNIICSECDAVYMLPGWENSKGARAEHATAIALGLQVIYENAY
jgi:hypothetical protein